MFFRLFFSLSLFLLLFPSFLLTPQPASAAAFGLVPCALQEDNPETSWDERKPCTLCHFLIGMNFVVKFLRNVMTAIAIAIMVAMAIMYIVSAGNEEMMAMAKKGIIGSLIGIVVILLAWVIVNFIFTLPIFANNGLVKTDGSWDTFTCNTTSQSGGTGVRNRPGIGNGTGSVGDDLPGRDGLPGPGGEDENQPQRCNRNGVCDAGETCTLCPNENCGGCIPPSGFGCGAQHYACINGDSESNLELADRWTWTCRGTGTHIGESRTCTEQKPTIPDWGCGPSDGTSVAPTGELCIGGAIASAVRQSAVGTSSRWDWTCTKGGTVKSCASGLLNVDGTGTAICGSAAGVPSATAPSSNLCAPPSHHVSQFGVGPIVDAVTGAPLWYWSCQVDNGVATSCYAPRT